jgi:hypothetical protein
MSARAGRPLFAAAGILVFVFAAFGGAPAEDGGASAAAERRELWTGSMYTSTYRAGICIGAGGDLRGMLYLRRADGVVDRYTVFGKVAGEDVTAGHSSGHVFMGRFVSPELVQGELTLKNGHRMNVRAARSHTAEMDEDCRPALP